MKKKFANNNNNIYFEEKSPISGEQKYWSICLVYSEQEV